MSNTVFWYDYADGHNFKQDQRIVLRGELSFEQIAPYLDEGEFFIPGQVGLEDLQHRFARKSEVDHPWHRIRESDVTPTDEIPTDEQITAEELLAEFQRVVWDVNSSWEERSSA